MKKLNYILVLLSLTGALIVCLSGYYFFYLSSVIMAADVAKAGFDYMQYPILALCYLMLLGFIVTIGTAIRLVYISQDAKIFSTRTVKHLQLMGHATLFSFLSCLSIYIYGYSQMGKEVGLVGGQVLLFSACIFAAMNIIYFLANLFARSVAYKEESDLVV
ncbi:MAG: DUF2975 domain-containing protein [Eubacteriales bacterium]|nr:DUF2975 domain-containing protein [Eubacteriales bacterium]